MFRSILRAAGLSPDPARQARADRHRSAGDAARDQRLWAEAAEQYHRYLKLVPRDFDIHVQHGHSLKEAGRLDEAAGAYRRAGKLRPRDADLLLSSGHLAKLRGDYPAAVRHYAASLAADEGSPAQGELTSELLAPHLTQAHHDLLAQRQRRVLKALTDRCAGLTALVVNDVALDKATGRFVFETTDPWIEFECDANLVEGVRVAELRFTIDLDGDIADGRLYLGYEGGFTERHQLVPRPDGDGICTFLLIDPARVKKLRWDPAVESGEMRFARAEIRPIRTLEALEASILRLAPDQGDYDPVVLETALATATRVMAEDRLSTPDILKLVKRLVVGASDISVDYDYWLSCYVAPQLDDYATIERMTAALGHRPRFSFVMPVYNPPPRLLRECIDSMLAQTYPDFELCIADDRSPNPEIRAILEDYAAADPRVKVDFRRRNGHISAASNSALALATGDFVVLVDHDDLVPDYCLFVVALYVNRHPDAAIFYSDEDKVDLNGDRSTPYFKGDFNQFLLYGHNMISHLGVYRRDLLTAIGGFRMGLEGSQDYDLFLRCFERVGPAGVVHIPHVLYHWRMLPGSTSVSADQKSYAIFAAQNGINGYFERGGIDLRSVDGFAPGCTGILSSREYDTTVSIIIPTRDGLDVLEPCIESILMHDHADAEILIVDNGSVEPETLAYFDRLRAEGTARILSWPEPFNFSAINNFAAAHASGQILCFLNNDTEVMAPKWLQRARMLLSLPEIGMVGARLLYPDATLQHFGIVVGAGDHGIGGTPHGGYAAHDPGYFGKARLIQEFSAVTAACMFVRKADFDAVGGFDPTFRVAYNDIDLCLRIRAAGFRIVADPEILLTHKESKTRGSDKKGDNADRLEAEAATMRDRWGTTLADDPYWSPNLSIARMDFALAYPPRVPMPWLAEGAWMRRSPDDGARTGGDRG